MSELEKGPPTAVVRCKQESTRLSCLSATRIDPPHLNCPPRQRSPSFIDSVWNDSHFYKQDRKSHLTGSFDCSCIPHRGHLAETKDLPRAILPTVSLIPLHALPSWNCSGCPVILTAHFHVASERRALRSVARPELWSLDYLSYDCQYLNRNKMPEELCTLRVRKRTVVGRRRRLLVECCIGWRMASKVVTVTNHLIACYS